MEVTFYTILDDNRVLNKTLGNGEIKDIVDLDGTVNLLNPTFKIKKGDLSKSPTKYNYCHIGNPYNRYYFLNAKTPTIGHIFNCECKVDVLMSHDLSNIKGILERSTSNYNTYISDSSYTVERRIRTQTKKFPNGFNDENLILICNG